MATHSSVLAWRIPGTGEPGGLPDVYGVAQSRTWRRQWHPLQYSCLENPMDGGAWRAGVDGVARSGTRLKRLSTQNCCNLRARRPRVRVQIPRQAAADTPTGPPAAAFELAFPSLVSRLTYSPKLVPALLPLPPPLCHRSASVFPSDQGIVHLHPYLAFLLNTKPYRPLENIMQINTLQIDH